MSLFILFFTFTSTLLDKHSHSLSGLWFLVPVDRETPIPPLMQLCHLLRNIEGKANTLKCKTVVKVLHESVFFVACVSLKKQHKIHAD